MKSPNTSLLLHYNGRKNDLRSVWETFLKEYPNKKIFHYLDILIKFKNSSPIKIFFLLIPEEILIAPLSVGLQVSRTGLIPLLQLNHKIFCCSNFLVIKVISRMIDLDISKAFENVVWHRDCYTNLPAMKSLEKFSRLCQMVL